MQRLKQGRRARAKVKGEGEGQNKGHEKKDPQEQEQEQDKEFGICMHINSNRCQHFDKQGQYFLLPQFSFQPHAYPT